MSTEGTLRITVAALMEATGEVQGDLAAGLRISQATISRRQRGGAPWSLDALDALSAHYGIPVPDLLYGPTHAIERLPAARRTAGGHHQTTIR